MINEHDRISVNRWRLILGSYSGDSLNFYANGDELRQFRDMEQLLDYLYSRAQGDDVRESENRCGGNEKSNLMAAEWITKIRELFPKQTAEVLESHALEKFGMTELLTDKEILERMTPDVNLLKTILQLKHLMKGDVLKTAENIADKVAKELSRKIENDVKRAVSGQLDRNSSSCVRSARNLDFKKTVQRNLKNYDRDSQHLIIKDLYFSNRIKNYNNKRVIIAIDESGSMLGSVIYSAVMAQIISSLPFAEIKLVIFDTSVVRSGRPTGAGVNECAAWRRHKYRRSVRLL